MNFPTLSAHAEEFLALKRAVAKVDPHRNTQDRRSLKHREKLLRSFIAYWRDRGCPWPMRSSLLLDWIAVGSHRQHPYRDQRRFYVVRAFLQQIRTFESATEIPENIYRPLVSSANSTSVFGRRHCAFDGCGLASSRQLLLSAGPRFMR